MITFYLFERMTMMKSRRGRYNVYIYILHFSRLAKQQVDSIHLATLTAGERRAYEWYFFLLSN